MYNGVLTTTLYIYFDFTGLESASVVTPGPLACENGGPSVAIVAGSSVCGC